MCCRRILLQIGFQNTVRWKKLLNNININVYVNLKTLHQILKITRYRIMNDTLPYV